MDTHLHTHVAFHLTGRTITADLDPVDQLALRPALLARYRDLSALRYDFPVVLRGQGEQTSVESLSGLIDAALGTCADDESIDRLTAHALRLEREIRVIVADGGGGPFDAVWDLAALRLTASGDAAWRDSLDRLRAAVRRDGEIVDCDAAMPTRLLRHLWSATQAKKARTFGDRVALLLVKLGDILRADFAQSPQSRTATALEASFGEAHEEAFDFEALAQVLEHRVAAEPLPDQRRRRIERLIQILESQRFWVRAGADAGTAPYAFVFDTCQSAFAACRERAPQMAVVAQALAAAELEVRGDYRAPHDVFFGHGGAEFAPLAPEEQALFPDYLVTLNEAMLTPLEQATLTEMLAAGLPVKILLQIDDLLTEPSTMDDPVSAGGRARELIHMAIGLNDVYALQASASHLVQRRHDVVSGLEYAGAALFSVFSGATGVNDLPPYLVAAAAMESRAFPAFTYDPAAGGDWASRFSLDVRSGHVASDVIVPRAFFV